MPVLWKAITPKRLDTRVWHREFRKAAQPVRKGIEADYYNTYRTFSQESKPKKIVKVSIGRLGSVEIRIQIIGFIYGLLETGTPPHQITAKNAPRLVFQVAYKAKTSPGRLAAQAGGPSGERVFAISVQHPGFPARNFSQKIAAKWNPIFIKTMNAAMRKAAKASGHYVK